LQELLAAENAVSLAQGEIDTLNKEYQGWQRHWGVIEDTDGQFRGILNESLLSEEVTEAHLRQQVKDFNSRKNVLLGKFHSALGKWAELKQRHAQVLEHVNALPTLPPA
jgi:hypothetical protein